MSLDVMSNPQTLPDTGAPSVLPFPAYLPQTDSYQAGTGTGTTLMGTLCEGWPLTIIVQSRLPSLRAVSACYVEQTRKLVRTLIFDWDGREQNDTDTTSRVCHRPLTSRMREPWGRRLLFLIAARGKVNTLWSRHQSYPCSSRHMPSCPTIPIHHIAWHNRGLISKSATLRWTYPQKRGLRRGSRGGRAVAHGL